MYAPGDMNQTVGLLGILPAKLVPRFNKSGTVTPAPGIKVTAVHAEHSSVVVWKNPATGKDEVHPGGEPVGYIIELENGFDLPHGRHRPLRRHEVHRRLLPTGPGPDAHRRALHDGSEGRGVATREWLKPKYQQTSNDRDSAPKKCVRPTALRTYLMRSISGSTHCLSKKALVGA